MTGKELINLFDRLALLPDAERNEVLGRFALHDLALLRRINRLSMEAMHTGSLDSFLIAATDMDDVRARMYDRVLFLDRLLRLPRESIRSLSTPGKSADDESPFPN